MYYIIQSNIYSDPEHHKVFEVLEDLNLGYLAFELDTEATEIALSSDRKDIFVYGSVKMARLARAHSDWKPGSFYGGNHTFEAHAPHYGANMLNFGAEVFRFADEQAWLPGESKFVKPYLDAKVFTGKVFQQAEWQDFVRESLDRPRTPMLTGDTLVQASKPRQLIKEARVWIVGGTIVGAVYYRFHGDVQFEREVAREGLEFAAEMVRIFEVAEAFVMDIGLTDAGWKIVEINCINSAGFYSMNVRALFRALEAYFS